MTTMPNTETGEADSLVVHLIRPPGEAVRVASVELILPDMRNRYSFRDHRSFDEVFVPQIANAMRSALQDVNATSRVVTLPDFTVQIPDLVLSGLRILVTHAQDGVQYLMLRFRKFIGTVKRAFRFEAHSSVESTSIREKIAVEVLNDIVTPLFDIMSLNGNGLDHLVENHTEVLRQRINGLASRKEEIAFYISMLQRYVAGCKSDQDRNSTPVVQTTRLERTVLQ